MGRRRARRSWGPAQEAQHPRDRRGRFTEAGTGGDWIERMSARMGGVDLGPRDSTHQPDWAGKLSMRMTEAELVDRLQQVQGVVGEHMHLSTHITHRPDGRWSDERAALHRLIVDEFYDRYKSVPHERKALMAGGLGGAGKTTTLRGHSDYEPAHYMPINPDDFKEEIAARGLAPEIPGHDLSPLERATLYHPESSHLAEMLAARAYAEGRNVMWDATMGEPGAPSRRIADLKRHGYTVDGVFVHVPVETSIARIRARYDQAQREWMESRRGLGGRPTLPEHVIRAAALPEGRTVNLEIFEELTPHFSRWSLYDNTGSTPVLVSRG